MVFYHCNRKKKPLRYKVQQDPKQEKPALLFDNLLYYSTRNESTDAGLSQLHKSDITQSPSIADHLGRFLHLSRPPHWGAGDQTSSMCKMSRREASRHGIEGPFVSQRTTQDHGRALVQVASVASWEHRIQLEVIDGYFWPLPLLSSFNSFLCTGYFKGIIASTGDTANLLVLWHKGKTQPVLTQRNSSEARHTLHQSVSRLQLGTMALRRVSLVKQPPSLPVSEIIELCNAN